ncbi:methyltransferase domain-containing protein [Candidatus Babeliales bacterium]|nr:methyltransferase domain-containing protein [Candidatus Babeliales bacterium]
MQKKKLWMILGLVVFVSSTMLSVLKNHTFLESVIKDPVQMGTIVPCSGFTGEELSRYVDQNNKPNKILEAGGGSGAITEKIIKKLKPSDVLDVVEIDPNLCKILRDKFNSYKNVKIHCCSITDYSSPYKYDYIISTLPFNAFKLDFVKQVRKKFEELVNTGGCLSYVEYTISAWKQYLPFIKDKDIKGVVNYLSKDRSTHSAEKRIVWLNVPPTYVYHQRM